MMCKNALETEWQQLHDHEREPGHDTNAQVGESASKWYVHFELADHQSASRWCWWFCTGSFVTSSSLFFVITSVKSEWSKTDKIKKSSSERACAVEVCFTSSPWWWFCFAFVHQSEQHHWPLHSPALMSTRSVSIAYVQLSTGRHACFIVISHLCRFPGRLISLTQASQHTHLLSCLSHNLTLGPHAPACSVHERPSARLHQNLRGASFLVLNQICADDSTFIFPDKYCSLVRLPVSRRSCPHVAPRISGSWSRWCSTTCRLTVTEKGRAGPSLASRQNYQELSSAWCLDPAWFGAGKWKATISSKLVPLLPEDYLVVVCQHGQIASSVWILDQHFRTMRRDFKVRHRRGFGFSSAWSAPTDQERRHEAHVGAGGWKCERLYRSWYVGRQRERKKKKSTLAIVCGILPSASYVLKPWSDDVQHSARCVSEPPTSFWNAWFVIIRHHKVSEGTKRTCEKFPPDSSVFLADIVRTLQRGTFAQCRACSSVQAISSELILLIVFFPWVSAIPQNSFPISPLHTFAKATSTIGRVPSILELTPSAPDFSPPVLLSYNFSSSSCLTRLKKAFLFHIVFQVPFLGNTLHLQPRREPLEFPVEDCWSTTWSIHQQNPTSGPRDTSWLHACRIQDNPIPLVSSAACGVPLLRKLSLAQWHNWWTADINKTTAWWGTFEQMIWDLEMALEIMWIVCATTN